MKVLLRFLLMVVLVIYLFVAFFVLRSHAAEEKCLDLQVEVLDSATHHYVSPADVYGYIEEYDLDPCGKPMGEVNTEDMERTLMLNGVLGSVECYKKAGGTVCVEVTQRIPVMRVMANGSNYYVDTEGHRIVALAQYRTPLPLVTGQVDSTLT